MAQPFDGIRVLDLTHVLAGPFCTYQLGLLGAEIIKVEDPASPDITRGRGLDADANARDMGLTYASLGGNKKNVSINLKTKAGVTLLKRLVAQCQVFVHNFRQQKLDGLGLGYAEITAVNPQIIYCAISGFGQGNDRSHLPAYDNVIQALSGIMDSTGGRKTGASIVDIMTGQNAALAISSALFRWQREGTGALIDCSMLGSALQAMAPEISSRVNAENAIPAPSEPNLGCYKTKDRDIVIGAFTFAQHKRLWTLLGDREIAAYGDWPQIWAHAALMREKLSASFAQQSAQSWVDQLRKIDVPVEVVSTLEEAIETVSGWKGGPFSSVTDGDGARFTACGSAFSFDAGGPDLHTAPGQIGQDTLPVLAQFGLSQNEISELLEAGVVVSC